MGIVTSPIRASMAAGGLACGLGLMAGAAEAQSERPADIVVTAQPTAPVVGLAKITGSILDTPQSISIVTAAELRARAVTTLTDAVRVVPGISLGAGETSWQGNNLILRGFTTRNDTFLDGMRDYGYYFRDPFNASAIEVLKGPSAMLFGRGATGGVIHQVSKEPEREGRADGTLIVGSDDTTRATADLGVAIGTTGAVRLNAMAHRSRLTDRDGALNKRWGFAPSVALGIGTPTRLTLSWLHQREDNRPDYGIPWFNGAPAKVKRGSFYGFSDDYLDTRVDIGTVRLIHDLAAGVSLRAQLRYSNSRRTFRTSEAVIPAAIPATAPLSTINVTRNEFSGFSTDRFLQGQLDVTARFTTGRLTHALVAGVEAGRERPQPTYIFHVGVIGTSLVDPPPQSFAQTAQYVRLTARTRAETLAGYALDTITLGSHLQALVGVRWDKFDAHYRSQGFNPAGAVVAITDLKRDDDRLSGRAALIYKPDAAASLYLSYANSFDPSASGIESLVSAGRTVAQANINAEPETSRIWEAGAKQALFGNRMLLTAALFRTIKTNVRVPDPTVAGFNTNGGRQRVQGIEFEGSGQLTPAWSFRFGYAYLDSETLASSNPLAAASPRVGERLTIVPRHSGSVQSDYRLGARASIGGGIIYQSSRLGQNTNASLLRAPGYALFEARASYRLASAVLLQANVQNLTDKLFYDQLHPVHVVPGAGRTFLLSLIVGNR